MVNLLENENCNTYEILPPNIAVKPYFDLEMEAEGLDHETIADKFNLFVNWLMTEIKTLFNIELIDDDFIILDSCRENKLSFHLIIQNHFCFNSVAELNIFIKYLWNRKENPHTAEEAAIFGELHYAFSKSIQERQTLFIN